MPSSKNSDTILCEDVWLKFTRRVRPVTTILDTLKDVFHPGRAHAEAFWALQGIRFSLRSGEALGIIGQNGSGKSTLLKVLGRIFKPDRGRVAVQGRIFPFLELGTGFEPELTGAENIYLNGVILRIKKRDLRQRFQKIVEFAELEDVIDTPLKHYSTGMQMRLGFSIAMHGHPDILLIDEVMAVGDEAFQKKCIDSIHEFRERGGTILFVSHAMDHVRQLCDQALWLNQGAPAAIGKSDEVVGQYLKFMHRKEMETLEKRREEEKKKKTAGTREIEIREVVFLDENGHSTGTFQTYSRMTVRVRFHAKRKIPRPVFGVSIHHVSGTWICGPNTTHCGESLKAVEGDGSIEFSIARLVLLPGIYLFTVGIFDSVSLYPFDYREQFYKFTVEFGAADDHRGLVAMDYSWNLNPEGRFQLEPREP